MSTDWAEKAHAGGRRPTTGRSSQTARDPLQGEDRPTTEAEKATLRSKARKRSREQLKRTIARDFLSYAERENTPMRGREHSLLFLELVIRSSTTKIL